MSSLSSLITSSTSSPTKTRPRRASRFTEGSAATGPEIFQRTQTSNEFLFSILSEQDAHEQQKRPKRQHQHCGSQSSISSFDSSTASSPTSAFSMPKEKEGRRSIVFNRASMDERPRELVGYAHGESEAEKIAKKVKGRLRAWTVGNKDVKPYPGT